ncbi:hypothetical protein N6H14_10565 [Paenibacillus sp. CC-CFT747]|nr:hypothetical protein N6H14_10565 [Paenibacillus sp. CC-CFT747]
MIGVYGFSIIAATMYLKIHWVLDVAAGMLFAYGCVKLSDWIVGSRFFAVFTERFEGLGSKLEAARPFHSRPEAGREATKDIA